MDPQREHFEQARDMLREGKLPFNPDGDELEGNTFCMNWERMPHSCGTVMCIGGLAYTLANPDEPNIDVLARQYVNRRVGERGYDYTLHELFYPSNLACLYDKITPLHAAQAVDNWLENGDPRWTEIVQCES